MNLQLDDDTRLVSDERQYVLQRRLVKARTQESYWVSFAYFQNMGAAIEAYAHRALRLSTATSLRELYADFDRVLRRLQRLIPSFEVRER